MDDNIKFAVSKRDLNAVIRTALSNALQKYATALGDAEDIKEHEEHSFSSDNEDSNSNDNSLSTYSHGNFDSKHNAERELGNTETIINEDEIEDAMSSPASYLNLTNLNDSNDIIGCMCNVKNDEGNNKFIEAVQREILGRLEKVTEIRANCNEKEIAEIDDTQDDEMSDTASECSSFSYFSTVTNDKIYMRTLMLERAMTGDYKSVLTKDLDSTLQSSTANPKTSFAAKLTNEAIPLDFNSNFIAKEIGIDEGIEIPIPTPTPTEATSTTLASLPFAPTSVSTSVTEAAPNKSLRQLSPEILPVDPVTLCLLVHNSVQALAKDGFWVCFQGKPRERRNWNIYLYPLWLISAVLRYGVMLPVRLLFVAVVIIFTLIAIMMVECLRFLSKDKRRYLQNRAVFAFCKGALVSFHGAVQYHGDIPKRRAGQIFVANHTTPLDFIILAARKPFSVLGQRHKSSLGFFEHKILEHPLDALFFDRNNDQERTSIIEKIRAHIFQPVKDAKTDFFERPPLLMFPEGVCVANSHTVQFKSTFAKLGAEVCPVAIKYNMSLCPTIFWNVSCPSFTKYLLRQWCTPSIVANVYFLDPMKISRGETPEHFAKRVQLAISRKIGLIPTDWNGYLKHLKISKRIIDQRKKDLTCIITRSSEKELKLIAERLDLANQKKSLIIDSCESHTDLTLQKHDEQAINPLADSAGM